MITIYKDKRQIPSNMEIVELNDIFFNQNTTEFIDSRAVEIVQQIDGARLVGKYKIIYRFHGKKWTSLLHLSCSKERKFRGLEFRQNVMERFRSQQKSQKRY